MKEPPNEPSPVELVAGTPDAAQRRERSPSRDDELPVVARLVVEIRSDGSRTIARGAIEDVATAQRATVEAHGASPLQLALSLARALTQLPRLSARSAVRGLLGRGRRDPSDR